MFVASYSFTYCIYVPGKQEICFYYYCAVYDECKYLDTFWFSDRTRLFVQYTISLSSLFKLIWRHWTYNMSVRYILSSVWVRLSIFSPSSIILYVGLYVFSLPISLVMIEIIYIYIYTLSYYHHQIGSMNYYPLLRVRSLNNGVRCMSFYILILLNEIVPSNKFSLEQQHYLEVLTHLDLPLYIHWYCWGCSYW